MEDEPEKRLGLPVPFDCKIDDLKAETEKAVRGLAKELESATIHRKYRNRLRLRRCAPSTAAGWRDRAATESAKDGRAARPLAACRGLPGFTARSGRERQVTMDEVFKHPTWWESAPNPRNEYPAMEQYWKGIDRDIGVDPAQGQAGGWLGGGHITGLGSPPETAAQSFQNRLFNTAQPYRADC
jgi:hypothetical protein